MSRGDPGRPPQALSPSRVQAQDPGAYLSLDSGSNGNANSPRSPRSAEDDYDYQMNNMSLLKAQLKVFDAFFINSQCSKIRKKSEISKVQKSIIYIFKNCIKSIFAPEKSPKIAFLVILNFFLVQKLMFYHF